MVEIKLTIPELLNLKLERAAKLTGLEVESIIRSAITREVASLISYSIEDLIEEIVGELRDEDETDIVREGEHTYVVPGSKDVDRLNELFGVRVDDDHESSTVAGLVSEIAGRIPQPGEIVENHGLRFEVLASTDRRIERLRISEATPDQVQA